MGQRITYENLFTVNILHHFCLNKGEDRFDAMEQEEKDRMVALYDARDIFEITPSPDCMQVMRSNHCIFKNTPSGILLGIKVMPDTLHPGKFKPVTPLGNNLSFRFLIRLRDPGFGNYTALPLQGNENAMYVFKNFKAAPFLKFPSLSAIPPVFNNGTVYFPGDMLSDDPVNQTKLFTTLVKTSNNTSTAADWLSETGNATTPVNYANVNDRFPVANGLLYYTMKELNAYPVAVIKSLNGETINPKTEVLPGDFNILQADMRIFPEGFYTIHIESTDPGYQDDITFYLLHQGEVPFGLIEIKVNSDQADYNLTEDDHLLSPVFELRFRNRLTHWRYIGKLFDPPFVVEDPLPLTRYGYIEVVKPDGDGGSVILPNPSGTMIRAEALIEEDEKKFYSEIHIN